ncbi:GGDEF domain [Vibrio ponticus]|nr:GGDEF domain [Vibrio ponticus]
MDEFELDGTSTLRVKVLKGMSIGIGSLALLLAIGNVTIGHSYMLAFSELLYALYSWYLYKQIKNKTLKLGINTLLAHLLPQSLFMAPL